MLLKQLQLKITIITKIKNMRAIVFLLLCATSLSAFAQDDVAQDAVVESKIALSEKLEGDFYSIQFPEGWEETESDIIKTTFMLVSPPESESDLFRENISFIKQDIAEYDFSLEDYTALSKAQLKTMLTDYKLLKDSAPNDENKLDYHELVYAGNQGTLKLFFIQRYWVENGHAYVLTFTLNRNAHESFLPLAYEIMNSFELKID